MDMEICYVPAAKLKDVQEMMANWKKNNKIIRFSAIAAILMSSITMYYLIYSDCTMTFILYHLPPNTVLLWLKNMKYQLRILKKSCIMHQKH
jgi:hypothetical protein